MTAKRAKDLPGAKKLWQIFHDKENPRELIDVSKPVPKRWALAGRAAQTLYSSDKWNPDGQFDAYYHVHDDGSGGGVWLYVPVGTFTWAAEEPIPVETWPDAGAVLGTADGFLMERADSGKQVEAYCADDALLCAFPDGSALFVYDPKDGVIALVIGDPLDIGREGIEG